MKRIFLFSFLCLALFAVFGFGVVNAEETILGSGACGTNLTWSMSSAGELRISGTGEMEDYLNNGAPWYNLRTEIFSTVIEPGVISIGSYAFSNCSNLTNVSIPSSVIFIGNYAFISCSSLTSVTIPSSVTSIGEGTFFWCSSLTSITIPGSVTSIGDNAFNECSSITSVAISSSVTYIGGGAFYGCSSLTTIAIPSNVIFIGDSAFFGCSKIASVSIAEGVVSIGNRAFSDCINLTNVSIPSSVTWVGNYAFFGCSSLTSATILSSATSIGEGAFFWCRSLTSITFPGSVTYIGDNCFYECSSLTSVALPSGVTYIGGGAFYGCGSLTSIIIPSSVTYIGNSAFSGCAQISAVLYTGTVEEWAKISIGSSNEPLSNASRYYVTPEDYSTITIGSVQNGTVTLSSSFCLIGSTVSVTATPNMGYDFAKFQVDGVDIEGNTFVASHNHVITATFEPKTFTASIGNISYGKVSLSNQLPKYGSIVIVTTTPNIGYELVSIQVDGVDIEGNTFVVSGNHVVTATFAQYGVLLAFGTCGAEVDWGLLDSGQLIIRGSGLMYDYSASNTAPWYSFWTEIKSIEILNGVSSIENYAFDNCRNLTSVTIPSSVTSIGVYAFNNCSSLTSVIIPSSVTYIENYAFFGCSSLTSVTIPSSVTSIREGTFFWCRGLTSITIPSSVTSIGDNAFYECSSLTNVAIPNSVTSIGGGTFYGCSGLESVVIPEGVIAIGGQAFSVCTSLKSFSVHENNPNYRSDKWGVLFTKDVSTLISYPSQRILPYYNVPDETTTIGIGAFNACVNLVNLYIPSSVTNLESSSISNCPGVTICVYMNSPADAYIGINNLTAFYMDNSTLQGIDIYNLPEQTVYPLGQEDFSGLYLVANYGSRQLQLDDYELSYNMNLLGLQTVMVEHSGETTSFEIVLFDTSSEQNLDFGAVTAPEGTLALVAVYDEYGKMIYIDSAIITNSQCKAVISNSNFNKMSKAKLFILDGLNLTPQRQEYRILK